MRRTGGAAVGMVLAVALAGCGSAPSDDSVSPATSAPPAGSSPSLLVECEPDDAVQMAFDGPTWEDLTELTKSAAVVVVVEVTEDRECVVDTPDDAPESHYAISRVAVEGFIHGSGAESLTIVQPSGDHEQSTELRKGERLVLFLGREDGNGSSLDDKVGPRFYPLGWDTGVADLAADGTVQSRYGGLAVLDLDALDDVASQD